MASFKIDDWDRAVRHGLLPGGALSIMPSEDYQLMSDRELSDIIAYVRTFPKVDKEMPPKELGPVGKILMATGKLGFSYDKVPAHDAAHQKLPPPSEVTVEFGQHLAGVCTGCHREHLEGGPIPFGPPDWAPAANLTQHDQGLKDWTYDQFVQAMKEGKRPNGEALKLPMTLMMPYLKKMTDTEMKALWAFLQAKDPMPTGT